MATIVQIKQLATDNLSDILANPKRKPTDIKAVIDLLIDNVCEVGEIKYLKYNLTQRNDHFDGSGAGKSTSKWFGWQIINGQNGTTDDGGLVHINYKPTVYALGDTGGSKDAVVVDHGHEWLHSIEGDDDGTGGSYAEYTLAPGSIPIGAPNNPIKREGVSGQNKNMQPYRVVLAIQRMA